jgi:single stranded DNA-binding protein
MKKRGDDTVPYFVILYTTTAIKSVSTVARMIRGKTEQKSKRHALNLQRGDASTTSTRDKFNRSQFEPVLHRVLYGHSRPLSKMSEMTIDLNYREDTTRRAGDFDRNDQRVNSKQSTLTGEVKQPSRLSRKAVLNWMWITMVFLISCINIVSFVNGWQLSLPRHGVAPHRQRYDRTPLLVPKTSTNLFSTPFDDDEDEDDDFSGSRTTKARDDNGGPSSSSALEDDVDYASFQDIDFNAMDPLSGMTFEEYERYLTSSNTPIEHLEWDDSVPTINQIYVVGRVGNVPEARYLPDNNVVVSLSIALPRYYNYWEREDLQVEYGHEETEWYNLECWGQLGEFVMKNVEKGTRVGVIGAIDQDYYPNKQSGMLSSNCKILVQDLDILESKMEAESRKENKRGPSLYTSDDEKDADDDNDDFGPGSLQGGGAGGFFDPF